MISTSSLDSSRHASIVDERSISALSFFSFAGPIGLVFETGNKKGSVLAFANTDPSSCASSQERTRTDLCLLCRKQNSVDDVHDAIAAADICLQDT